MTGAVGAFASGLATAFVALDEGSWRRSTWRRFRKAAVVCFDIFIGPRQQLVGFNINSQATLFRRFKNRVQIGNPG
jgi:hypothetical protein